MHVSGQNHKIHAGVGAIQGTIADISRNCGTSYTAVYIRLNVIGRQCHK